MAIKDILDKHGAFYAFNIPQRIRKMKDGIEYEDDGHDLYYPKGSKKALFKDLDEYFKGLRDDAIDTQIEEQSMKDKQMPAFRTFNSH